MKNLKDILNESMLNEGQEFDVAKDFELEVTSDIVDMLNDNKPDEIKQFDTEAFDNYSISMDDDDLMGAREMFSWFASLVKKAYTEDLGINWNPEDAPFQEVADLSSSVHGFVLSGDGDDGTFSIFIFKKPLTSSDKKKFKEFKQYFDNSGSVYVSELF